MRFCGDRAAAMVAAVLRPSSVEPRNAVVLTDAARYGASVGPSGFVDFVLVCALACAMLADTDRSMAISADLHSLAVPSGSSPFPVEVCGLARAWSQFGATVTGMCHRAAIAAAPPSPGNSYCFTYLFFSIYSFLIYSYCRQCMLLLCLSCGRACCAPAFAVVLVVHVMLLCYCLSYDVMHAMFYS
jgi:hypothetical protein